MTMCLNEHADISISHIRPFDEFVLDEICEEKRKDCPLDVAKSKTGFFISNISGINTNELKAIGLSDEFINIMFNAKGEDIDVIWIHQDGAVYKDFPICSKSVK